MARRSIHDFVAAAVVTFFFAAAEAASVAPVASEHGMVVTAQHLATKVGVEVLKQGGNAVDAAVAVGYLLAVVFPAAGNLGGRGFMTIQLADGRKTFLDFRETAPLAATATSISTPAGTSSMDCPPEDTSRSVFWAQWRGWRRHWPSTAPYPGGRRCAALSPAVAAGSDNP